MVREIPTTRVPIQKEFPAKFKEQLNKQREGKKTVVIVGFAPTTRDLAPYDDTEHDIEIWGLNEAYRHGFMEYPEGELRADRWFQIHKPWSYRRPENRNHPNHWLWLQNKEGKCLECMGTGKALIDGETCKDCNGSGTYKPKLRKDFPIYMQEEDPDVPGSERLPLQEIIDEFLTGRVYEGENPIEYFTSSFAYICGFALYKFKEELEEGRLRIEVYGFEMSTETEYHYQKGSTEFWLGLALGRGAEIFLPHHCQLLKGAKYGYEVTQMINRQELEFRKRQLQELEGKKVAALNAVSGRRQEIEVQLNSLQSVIQEMSNSKLTKKEEGKMEAKQEQFNDLMKQRQELMQKEINALSEANAVGGASQEINALLQYVDAQYSFEDAEMIEREPVPVIQPMQVRDPGEAKNGKRTEEAEN